MRNNLKAEGSLYADPTGDENSITSSSLVNFWFQKPPLPCVTFIGTVTQEAWAGHTGFLTCPRVLWVTQQWAGQHWQSSVTCHHQKIWHIGNHTLKTKKPPQDLKLQRWKGKKFTSEFIPPFYSLAFLLLLLSPTVLYEVGRPAKAQIHTKVSLEQKYLLKIFKETGQEK